MVSSVHVVPRRKVLLDAGDESEAAAVDARVTFVVVLLAQLQRI